jgi:hypothetical protein
MMFGLPTSETFQLDKDAEQTKLRMTMALSRNRLYSVVTVLSKWAVFSGYSTENCVYTSL